MESRITIESVALSRLRETENPLYPGRIIPFPDARRRICSLLTINKKTAKSVLQQMERKGYIRIIHNHGVQLNDF